MMDIEQGPEEQHTDTTQTHQEPYDTLEEPVLTTIFRDVKAIGRKVKLVMLPQGETTKKELRNWDLWGPLFLCLFLAIILGFNAKSDQLGLVFGSAFVIVWLGAAVVTLNAQLLGGNLSFFQSVCTLGYCLFPFDVAALICLFFNMLAVRSVVSLLAVAWALFASYGFISGSVPEKRKALALYPVSLFYIFIAFLITVAVHQQN
eukprot:gb/GECH01012595.1/.p1 GENE.gb/GECH01012595.1/~~gb/GECH01012595.1/.p1  ORF type:complete len:204 (+),score=28.79 gb/GECH01012595.1/:1-612(+)